MLLLIYTINNTPIWVETLNTTTFWLSSCLSSTTVYGNYLFLTLLYLMAPQRFVFFKKTPLLLTPLALNLLIYSNSIFSHAVSLNLFSGAITVHPHLVYAGYIFAVVIFLSLFYKNNADFFKPLNFFRATTLSLFLGLLLGGLWGATGIDWGAWWTWDLVEYPPLLILLLSLYIGHVPRLVILVDYVLITLAVALGLVIFLRLGFLATKHSFFKNSRLFFTLDPSTGSLSCNYSFFFVVYPPFLLLLKNKTIGRSTYTALRLLLFTPVLLAITALVDKVYKILYIISLVALIYQTGDFLTNNKKTKIIYLHAVFTLLLLVSYPFFLPHRLESHIIPTLLSHHPNFNFINVNPHSSFIKYVDHSLFSTTFASDISLVNLEPQKQDAPRGFLKRTNDFFFLYHHTDFFYLNNLLDTNTRPLSSLAAYNALHLDVNFYTSFDTGTIFMYFLFFLAASLYFLLVV